MPEYRPFFKAQRLAHLLAHLRRNRALQVRQVLVALAQRGVVIEQVTDRGFQRLDLGDLCLRRRRPQRHRPGRQRHHLDQGLPGRLRHADRGGGNREHALRAREALDGASVLAIDMDDVTGIGNVGDYWAVTASLNYKPYSNFVIRPEVRWDSFDGTIGPAGAPFDNGTEEDQLSAGFDFILSF